MRDRNAEISESRDLWKARRKKITKESEDHVLQLEQQIQAAKMDAEAERKRADEEHKRANKLQSEID